MRPSDDPGAQPSSSSQPHFPRKVAPLAISDYLVRQHHGREKEFDEFTRGRWKRYTKGGRKENEFIDLAVGDEAEYEPPSSGRVRVGTGTEQLIPPVNEGSGLNLNAPKTRPIVQSVHHQVRSLVKVGPPRPSETRFLPFTALLR